MKPFRFTLEAVRTVRQRQENSALEQYAHALALRQQVLARLEAVQQELGDCWHQLRAQMAGGCQASAATQAHDYQRSLVQRREECRLAVGTAERRVNAALQTMLATRRQRELVDKFFEQQRSRHQRDQARAEQKMLDDLAVRRNGSLLAWNPTEIPS